ncbi:hypothetical protein HELRODRAFT_161449 [Helobdella robusta]|uniref:Uncharacterized protein n=1 Tax=Helobdella robusta TaxID=6412 RepID=T1ERH3_HELRO|nr:hypothetical protein HELRODRAFT_161449 [Helobdella robusta]ESO02208.1 hypothetical protein HELRODRAFT_161449 [Helobdella robusta]
MKYTPSYEHLRDFRRHHNLKKNLLKEQPLSAWNNNNNVDDDVVLLDGADKNPSLSNENTNDNEPNISYIQSELMPSSAAYPTNEEREGKIYYVEREPVKKKVEKRGRWQGFCFRRMRNRRMLPYICWRAC